MFYQLNSQLNNVTTYGVNNILINSLSLYQESVEKSG